MVNQKRKVSHTDYIHCYKYFARAIQTARFLSSDEYDSIRDHAKHHFLLLSCKENDSLAIQTLQNWIDQFIDHKTWSKCYRSANQKRYIEEHSSRTINLNNIAHSKLKSYALIHDLNLSEAIIHLIDEPIMFKSEKLVQDKLNTCAIYRNLSQAALIEKLVDTECKSIQYEKERIAEEIKKTTKETKIYKINNRTISKLFSTHLDHLNRLYDPRDIYSDVTDFLQILVNDKIISGDIEQDQIVHSESIKVMRSNYFDFSSTIASFVASVTGTMDVFLTRQAFKTEHSIVFVGMPTNLEVAIRLYKIMIRQAGSEKSNFLKTLSKRMKTKNRSSRASEYMSDWTSPFDCLSSDEELYTDNSYTILCQYKDEMWSKMS